MIRKFLGKNNFLRAYVQYNAIMLVRILADNPGPTFTRNIDSKFVSTVKELLRDGRDMSVQQILRETLDTFEMQKSGDETLMLLITMWKSEKTKWVKRAGNDISSGLVSLAASSTKFQADQTHRCRRTEGVTVLHRLFLVSSHFFRQTKHHDQALYHLLTS